MTSTADCVPSVVCSFKLIRNDVKPRSLIPCNFSAKRKEKIRRLVLPWAMNYSYRKKPKLQKKLSEQ